MERAESAIKKLYRPETLCKLKLHDEVVAPDAKLTEVDLKKWAASLCLAVVPLLHFCTFGNRAADTYAAEWEQIQQQRSGDTTFEWVASKNAHPGSLLLPPTVVRLLTVYRNTQPILCALTAAQPTTRIWAKGGKKFCEVFTDVLSQAVYEEHNIACKVGVREFRSVSRRCT